MNHIQQVVKRDVVHIDIELKRKWTKNDLCGSEFADVRGDILWQGASSSGFQERAVKCTSLKCSLSRAMPILLDCDCECLYA